MRTTFRSRAAVSTLSLLSACLLRTVTAQDFMDRSFSERLQLYSDWTSQLESRGRSLAQSPASAPAPPPPSPSPSPSPSPKAETLEELQAEGCKVLRPQYTLAQQTPPGYANMSLFYNKVIPNSPNFGECCKSCQNDSNCQAWTRVAGGGDFGSFQNCYLKYDLTALDTTAGATANDQFAPFPNDPQPGRPALHYVNKDYPTILESGTIPDVFPAEYYGCPYNNVPSTPCPAPSGCNVNQAGQLVNGPCIGG